MSLINTFVKAVGIQMKIRQAVGISPNITFNADHFRISLNLRSTSKTVHEKMLKVEKEIGHLDKLQSSCGFLRYFANIDGIDINIYTNQCFYGGEPTLVEHQSRTKAHCPVTPETKYQA